MTEPKKFYRSCGLTHISRNTNHTFVSHHGNMGNTEQHVRITFDYMYFAGAYDNRSIKMDNTI